jgi:hypothetical protein
MGIPDAGVWVLRFKGYLRVIPSLPGCFEGTAVLKCGWSPGPERRHGDKRDPYTDRFRGRSRDRQVLSGLGSCGGDPLWIGWIFNLMPTFPGWLVMPTWEKVFFFEGGPCGEPLIDQRLAK